MSNMTRIRLRDVRQRLLPYKEALSRRDTEIACCLVELTEIISDLSLEYERRVSHLENEMEEILNRTTGKPLR